MKFKLTEKQTGYDAIGEYIRRFWKYNNLQETVICQIAMSYDGIKYEYHNEIASPCGFDDIEFLYDWWEGQQYIGLNGICYLSEIEIYSGIYNENGILISCDTCSNQNKYGSCSLEPRQICFDYAEWREK